MTHFEKSLDAGDAYAPAAPPAQAIKTAVLVVALLVYAAGFAILYPLAASSVAKSVAEGADPAQIQFVGP